MGCQGTVVIGDNLTFSITTHDPDTGVLTDADAPPAYRVYEDETGAAILNGTMTILDNANTTGFYTELIACTLANGFENGRSYNIYIEATVDSDQGGISYGFRAMTDIWSAATRTLTMSGVSVAAAVEGDRITILRGDTLSASLTGLGSLVGFVSLDFSVKVKLDLPDASAIIRIRLNASGLNDGLLVLNGADASAREANGSITIDDADAGDITIALEAEETDDLAVAPNLSYDVQLITAAGVTTLTAGLLTVPGDVTRLVA